MAINHYKYNSLFWDISGCHSQPFIHVNLLKSQPKQGTISYEFS
jgi:hypothetical protein